jgi:hypothetical protein
MDTTMTCNNFLAIYLFQKVNINHLSIPDQINQTTELYRILYAHTRQNKANQKLPCVFMVA